MIDTVYGKKGWTPDLMKSQKGKTFLITGATEEDLDQKGFYGPTGRSNWTGPVGAHKLEPHALDKAVAEKLWELSEKQTGIKWNF
jgi:hypothetical protein